MPGTPLAAAFIEIRPDVSSTKSAVDGEFKKIDATPTGRKIGTDLTKGVKVGSAGMGAAVKTAVAGAAGAVAAAGIFNFAKDSVEGYQDHLKVLALTAQVVKTTGGAAKLTTQQLSDLSDQVEKNTGVDGDLVLGAENLLLTFTNVRNEVGKGNDIFTQATGIVTDMSVALGTDAKGSAIQLGKALNDPITGVTALQKVGVSFTASQKDQIKTLVDTGNVLGAQKVILGELSKEFGGAAAAAETPSQRLEVAYHGLQDQVGQQLIPVLTKGAQVLTDDVIPATSSAIKFVTDHGTAAKAAGVAIVTLYGAVKLAEGAQRISNATTVIATGLQKALGTQAAATAVQTAVAGEAATTAAAVETTAARGAGLASSIALGPVGIAVGAVGLGLAVATKGFGLFGGAAKNQVQPVQALTDAITADGDAVGKLTTAQLNQTLQSNGAYDAGLKLGVAQNVVLQAALGNADAQRQVAAAVDKARGAYANATTTSAVFGSSTRAGGVATKQATQAQLDAKNAADKLAGSTGALNGQLGASKHAADNVAAALRGIPVKVNTNVTVASKAAFDAVSALNSQLDSVTRDRVVNISIGNLTAANNDSRLAALIGARAEGGPVIKGQPYVVGEKRAELFVPNVNGTIVPKVPDLINNRTTSQPAAAGGADLAPLLQSLGDQMRSAVETMAALVERPARAYVDRNDLERANQINAFKTGRR
ncbi:hypothetical protein ACSMXN_20830 [Jatrophihabitans sp. DSM 45814]